MKLYKTIYNKCTRCYTWFLWLIFLPVPLSAQKLTDYVDPLIGSGGHGHVFVGANVPFGGVQLGPDNFYKGWDWCSGYNYQDSMIRGFAHTHLSGTGIGDLSDVLIMPYTGAVQIDKGDEKVPGSGYATPFSHQQEEVKPGYYRVKLANEVEVELTASERVGFHRYHFPSGKEGHVMIDLKEGINDRSTDTYMEQVDDFTFIGYRASTGWAKKQMLYFAIKTSIPVKNFTLYNDRELLPGKKGKSLAMKGLMTFSEAPHQLQLKVGISPVSTEGALGNIRSEIPDWNFDAIAQFADEKWNKELGKIKIQTKSESDKRIFYTALYHASMHPSLFNDGNGDYRGADGQVYKNPGFNNYSVFSTWDTYRAAHPLYTLINPNRVNDFVQSMLAIFDQQGHLPIWHLMGYDTGTMVGISSQQIIAEAFLKGLKGFDAERAFQAMKATAMSDLRGLNYVQKMEAIPSDAGIHRAVAHGLEMAISDGSTALMAKAMGKEKDYDYFKKRSELYKCYYDAHVGFFRGKMKSGTWNPTFDPIKSVGAWATDYAEGNAWQYLWLVPQDVKGLIELMGGTDAFTQRLDTFFTLPADSSAALVDLTGVIGQYAHGNEPSHHIAYLYAFAGEQWKTAEKVRHIMRYMYHDQPNGIIGNEDCGQMSAWYIFSSLGFYPVYPASGKYVLGSPLFDEATIDVQHGKQFIMKTLNNSSTNLYIQQVKLNGEIYHKSYITQEDICAGGLLEVEMGDQPNTTFGRLESNRPD